MHGHNQNKKDIYLIGASPWYLSRGWVRLWLTTAILEWNVRLQWGQGNFKRIFKPFAFVDLLCYELLLIVGNAPLYQASPGHSILGTNFPGTRLDVTPFECHFERVLVTFPGCASGSVSRIKFTKRTLALEIGSLAFGQYAQGTEAATP